MPAERLTEEQKMKNKIKRDTKEYMVSVSEFLKKQNNGEVPFEFQCSLNMLEVYYEQFLTLNYEISKLDSLMVDSRYGAVPHPILKARDSVVSKLDMLLKQCSLTFKERTKLKITEPKVEMSPLEKFAASKMNNNIEKR